MNHAAARSPTLPALAATLALAFGAGCGDAANAPEREPARAEAAAGHEAGEASAAWDEMVASEELVLALGRPLRTLADAMENLRVPDAASREWFDAAVEVVDVAPGWPDAKRLSESLPVTVRKLPPGEAAAPASPHQLDLLRPLLDAVEELEGVGFGTLRGRFTGPDRREFETDLELSGRGRAPSGSIFALKGVVTLRWRRVGDGDADRADAWRIASWRTGTLTLHEAPQPLFREVLDALVPDAAARARARHSEHEAHVLRYLRDPDGFVPPTPHFHIPAHDRHPGVAVADVDGNGWDDVYVMPRWGRNLLFLNRGDGRLEERAAALGLDLEDHAAAALFADFDNDGDLDAFVGRTLEPSVYLENRGGRFEARPDALGGAPLPALVASLSAVDADADGLLDVYVSTYAANVLMREVKGRTTAVRLGGRSPTRVLADFLPTEDAEALHARVHAAEAHEFLSLPGPPNLLLRNRGDGIFEPTPREHPLRVFANTYQATWSDWDDDGDPDVYLAHDFSPNQMFRNKGDGRFRDVTEATGTADIGFGMGVGFGDYDRDGRFDLYVTNMYSKAGHRITGFFDDVDPRFRKMAEGNSLFRNRGDRFEHVSGEASPKLPVEIAGWSWGGQFGDLDNDGFLDLYALSGYYTAPREAEALVDI